MNILFNVQIYETPNDNGSDRIYFFTKELVNIGHNVKVITGNVDYKNAIQRFKSEKPVKKIYDGVEVTYAPVYTNFRDSYLKRFIFYISYTFSSLLELIKSSKDSDVIYGVSTPLTVSLISAILSKYRKIPFIFEVTDVWPDAAIHSGVLKNKFIIYVSKVIENFCYKSADKIICLTEGISSNIHKKGVPKDKIKLITNGIDLNLFKKINKKETYQQKKYLNISDKFVGLYLGAHGKYNSLNTILETAIKFKNDDDFFFILIGDGDEKEALIDIAKENNLKNILFLPPVKRIEASRMLAIADYFLLPNLKGTFFEGNLPNKFFDYLASERPVIVSGMVESGKIVQKINSGYVVDAENPVQLFDAIKKLKSLNPKQRYNMGLNGRNYVKRKYNRFHHVDELNYIFKQAVEKETN